MRPVTTIKHVYFDNNKKTEKNLVDVINVKILERAAYCSLIND